MFFGLEWLILSNILYPLGAIAVIEASDRAAAAADKKRKQAEGPRIIRRC